ncbi:MYND-type domain-containing protein [Mycena venus]|uniref:MYND-type domain-containing protein n=1 Tax=Mycena venus TaxID=2733690 RepID=A0A8H6YQ83_9AGAR|nr:MYND-type domain-containing protein [Mycena venus]
MDPQTYTWPSYTPPRNIDNFDSPWVPSPDSFGRKGSISQGVHTLVKVCPVAQQSYEPAPTIPERNIGNIFAGLCVRFRSRRVERGVENVSIRESPCATSKVKEVPLSQWRAFAAYSRPTINGVDVHNTFTPSPTPYRTLPLDEVDPQEVFDSLRSPSGRLHPERWIPGLQHPSLPPPPTGWDLPRPGEPLAFPWECQLNRYLKRAVSGFAPVYWNIQTGLKSGTTMILYGGPNDISIPLTPADLAEPATYPLLTHMYISAVACTDAGFPWKFMVVNPAGIRVRDVFAATIDNFSRHVFRSEYDKWTSDRQKCAELEWALRGGPQEQDGIRRLDYLCGQLYFRGLEYNPDRTGWILYVGSEW